MTGRGAAENSDVTSGIARVAMAEIVHALLSDAEVALFARFARPCKLHAGQWLFQRGHRGERMYVILDGQIELDFGEDLVIKTLGQQEFFGELGLLVGDHPRSASARALVDCEVLELGPADFHRLVESDPGLVAYFLRRTIMRVLTNEQALISQLRRRNHDLETALDNLYITTHQLTHTRELVRTDELTGLHNRRGLTLYLQECRADGSGLPQALLLRAFASKQDALDGFLGAAYALHIVATVAVMADARDLQKSVGNGDGSWFAIADQSGRGQLRGSEGDPGAVELLQEFVPTVYLYDNFPGGVGLSEPLWQRQAELVQRARELVQRCDCKAGCPACVGPVLAAQEEDETSPRALALRVLDLFDAEACQHVRDVVVTTREPMELLAP